MDRVQRRFLGSMTAAAAACAAVQGLSGVQELALYMTPFFLIVGLLLCGRFVGEERILRRRAGARPVAVARRARSRWPAAPRFSLHGLIERSPVSRRGPPAVLAAVSA